jgi:hypothetical protein
VTEDHDSDPPYEADEPAGRVIGAGHPPESTADGEGASPEVVRVAQAVAALDGLDQAPVGEHVGRYEVLHGELADALAAIDGI